MANAERNRRLLARLIIKQQGRCFYCNCQLKPGTGTNGSTLEHKHPKSEKGSFYSMKNLAAACQKCNTTKGSKSVEEFLSSTWLAIRIKKQTEVELAQSRNLIKRMHNRKRQERYLKEMSGKDQSCQMMGN